MEKRIQLRGHCPHCTRVQAVVNGGMAHHGYTVDFGYFRGTCTGHGMAPIERDPAAATAHADELARIAEREDDAALKLEQREVDPPHAEQRYSEMGYRKVRYIPYAELSDWDKGQLRAKLVHQHRSIAKQLRDMVGYLHDAAAKYGGAPLLEIDLDKGKAGIEPGDIVKVCGQTVEVVRIEERTAKGVGPRVNGQYMSHVVWEDENGKERAYPKRYARKV